MSLLAFICINVLFGLHLTVWESYFNSKFPLCGTVKLILSIDLIWADLIWSYTFIWQNGTGWQEIMWFPASMTGLSAKTLDICRATWHWHIPPPACHWHFWPTLYSSVDGYGGHAAGIPELFLELFTVGDVRDVRHEGMSIWDIWSKDIGGPWP